MTKEDVFDIIDKSSKNFWSARNNFIKSIFDNLQIYINSEIITYKEAISIIALHKIGDIKKYIPSEIFNYKWIHTFPFAEFTPYTYDFLIEKLEHNKLYDEEIGKKIFDFAKKTKTYGFIL